jgi:hypothetical protein
MAYRYTIITQYSAALRDRFMNDSQTGQDILYFHDLVPEGLSREIRNPHQCLYAETEERADIIAKDILRRNPGVTVSVGSITTIYTAKKPSKVDILTAKFTDQGLVPA